MWSVNAFIVPSIPLGAFIRIKEKAGFVVCSNLGL
jgi:hypothetical protein